MKATEGTVNSAGARRQEDDVATQNAGRSSKSAPSVIVKPVPPPSAGAAQKLAASLRRLQVDEATIQQLVPGLSPGH